MSFSFCCQVVEDPMPAIRRASGGDYAGWRGFAGALRRLGLKPGRSGVKSRHFIRAGNTAHASGARRALKTGFALRYNCGLTPL